MVKTFMLRISPSHRDRVPEALARSELIIGWSRVGGLTDRTLSQEDFRDRIHRECHHGERTLLKAGLAAGNMWRFIREMSPGDIVLVPRRRDVYVGRVHGEAYYLSECVADDTAYRRAVHWYNADRALSRGSLPPSVREQMNKRLTCTLIEPDPAELEEVLRRVGATVSPAAEDLEEPELPERALVQEYRVLRDTAAVRRLKRLHGDACQLCGSVLGIEFGWSYSEGHHIQPLGKKHSGPDVAENILILCPNCHALCDYGAIRLDAATIRSVAGHRVDVRYVEYHNANILRRDAGPA